MNLKLFLRLNLFLFLVWTRGTAAPAREGTATARARHTLWAVKGGSNTVYLLGSIHVLSPTNYPLAKPLEENFHRSAIVVFETDFGKMQSPAMQLKMMTMGSLPDGETLEERLSPEAYKKLKDHVEKSGLPLQIFAHLKPSVAALLVTAMELQKLGLDPEQGVDRHFYREARAEGKVILPLETVDEQLQLITGFSREEDEAALSSTLEELDQLKAMFGQLVEAWEHGRADRLSKLLNDAMKESPSIYKRLVTDRNLRWRPKIERLLEGDKDAIVIVGAGHLVGEGSVVELLRQHGFRVTQE